MSIVVFFFVNVELVLGDLILGLIEVYNVDSCLIKVNLGVGIYYDESGCILLFCVVKQIEQQFVVEVKLCGYLFIDGLFVYNQVICELVFGKDLLLLVVGCVVILQIIGGSGVLCVGVDLLYCLLLYVIIVISNLSWENYCVVFGVVGFEVVEYSYFDLVIYGVDFDVMLVDLVKLQLGIVVLLYVCCYNFIGVDFIVVQWKQVVELLKDCQLFLFIDMVYQGFDKGISEDGVVVCIIVEVGIDSFVVVNLYFKLFLLYGECIGVLLVVVLDVNVVKVVQLQVKCIICIIYFSLFNYGVVLVFGVFNSVELCQVWEVELIEMCECIYVLCYGLVEYLVVVGVLEFVFINDQVGMFFYFGLSCLQVDCLCDEFGIYVVGIGCICVVVLNQGNLVYVVKVVVIVVKG